MTLSTKGKQPAFPTDEYYDEKRIGQDSGMTLRQWFAWQALAGILANPSSQCSDESMAEFIKAARSLSYDFADAMLAEDEKS